VLLKALSKSNSIAEEEKISNYGAKQKQKQTMYPSILYG
jgi:hypothetical protein